MSKKSKKQLGKELKDKPVESQDRKWLSNTIASYTPPRTGVYKRDISKLDKDYVGYYRARQEPIFYNAFLVIQSMIFKTDLEFTSGKLKSTIKYYNNLVKYLKIKDFLKKCFEEMYLGQNQGLVVVDFERETGEISLRLITYYLQGKQRVFPILEKDSNEISHYNITDITRANKIIEQIPAAQGIQLSEINESLESDYSVLARVKHLIDLKFKMIEGQMKLACRDNQPQLYFTPDYKAFPTPTDSSQYNSLLAQVTEGFNNIGKELVNSLESNGLIASQIPMNVMKASLTNKELGFDELIRWIDEQIYLGCGLNGTFLNTENSNRASAEQGYDNVQETVINDWQDKLVKIVEWILTKVAGYDSQDYNLQFKPNVNQEMLEQRAQALVILKDVLPNINTLGYKVTNESVQKILNTFDLQIELDTQIPVIANPPTVNIPNQLPVTGRNLITDETFFSDSIRKVNVSKLPVTSFNNIDGQTNYKSIQSKLKLILSDQFDSWINKLVTQRIEVAGATYPSLDNYQSNIKQLITEYANIVEADYQKEYSSTTTLTQSKLTSLVTDKITETIKGSGSYEGFDSTTAKLIKSKIESEVKDGNIKDYFDSRKESFLADRFKSLEDGIFVNLYYEFSNELASDDGFDYVGAKSQKDNRVRPDHRINDERVWAVNSSSPSGKPSPWNDFGCRCSYYYNNLKTLLDLGFKQ